MGQELRKRIEIWKKLLLDLGKRNRLINFKEGAGECRKPRFRQYRRTQKAQAGKEGADHRRRRLHGAGGGQGGSPQATVSLYRHSVRNAQPFRALLAHSKKEGAEKGGHLLERGA